MLESFTSQRRGLISSFVWLIFEGSKFHLASFGVLGIYQIFFSAGYDIEKGKI